MATSPETLAKWKEEGFVPSDSSIETEQRISAKNPQDNPDDFTWVNSMGWVYTGDDRHSTASSEYTSWLNKDLGGPVASGIRVANTGNHSWAKGNLLDINPNDRDAIMAMYNDPNWNPFYGRYYALGDRPGVENNVADYLYRLLKDNSQAHNRDKVMRAYQSWLQNSGTGPQGLTNRLTARDMMNTEMSQGMFNALGLGNLGYQYQLAQEASRPEYTALNPMTGMLLGMMPPSFYSNVLPKIS
jgi:hypothetical protein